MDWLEYLQFGTEAPLGYAVFFGGCILGLVVCSLLVLLGLRTRRWLLTIPAVLMALAIVAVIAANIAFSEKVDFNSPIPDTALAGHWVDDDGSSVDLVSDHTVRFHFGDQYDRRVPTASGAGTWNRSGDFEIVIVPSNGSTAYMPPLRMIRFDDQPRLIVDDFEDPDAWDRHPGFRKIVKP